MSNAAMKEIPANPVQNDESKEIPQTAWRKKRITPDCISFYC